MFFSPYSLPSLRMLNVFKRSAHINKIRWPLKFTSNLNRFCSSHSDANVNGKRVRIIDHVLPFAEDIVEHVRTYVQQNPDDSMKRILTNLEMKLDPEGLKSIQPKPREKNLIYTNNYVNFENIDVIGFDLDYTLVTYTVELQKLIYDLAKQMLVKSYGYSTNLLEIEFNESFAIRGLTVDKDNGALCKLSHLQRVGRYVYRGRKALTAGLIEETYGEFGHVTTGEIASMRPLNDMFAMAEACLIADTMHILDSKQDQYGEIYHPPSVVDDILGAIREVHVSGIMHEAVLAEPDRFIEPSPQLYDMLMKYRQDGKKLFLCTNSGPKYAENAMKFVLGDRGESWRNLFDIIICSAQKPVFFAGKKPFRKWMDSTNSASPLSVNSQMEPGVMYVNGSVWALKRATGWASRRVLYVGDNLFADLVEARKFHGWQTACVINELKKEINVQNSVVFQQLHILRSTTRVLINELQEAMECRKRKVIARAAGLFVGHSCPHIYDGPNRTSISMEGELPLTYSEIQNVADHNNLEGENMGTGFDSDINLEMNEQGLHSYIVVEDEADSHSDDVSNSNKYTQRETSNTAGETESTKSSVLNWNSYQIPSKEEIRDQTTSDRVLIHDLEKKLQHINTLMSTLFNPQFGSAFRTDGSPTMFAFYIRRYVDLYMDDVCNMLNYSSHHRFFPSHAIHMAHDPLVTVTKSEKNPHTF